MLGGQEEGRQSTGWLHGSVDAVDTPLEQAPETVRRGTAGVRVHAVMARVDTTTD